MALRSLLQQFALTFFGQFVFSAGLVMNIQANVGLGPWPAVSYGAMLHVPMSFGQANMVIGGAMLGLSWLLGVRPGPGTAINIVMTSLLADLLLEGDLIPRSPGGLHGYVMLLVGMVVLALGTALYVKGGLGAGPRDSLMLGVAAHLGGRVGTARNMIDLLATGVGWLLGAQISLGTLIFALGVGPIVGFWFRLLRVPVRVHRRRDKRSGARRTLAPESR